MSETKRRPDKVGYYWYRWHGDAYLPVNVLVDEYDNLWAQWFGDMDRTAVDDLPGDFIPLTKPVAMPQPKWCKEPPTEPGDYWLWLSMDEELHHVVISNINGKMWMRFDAGHAIQLKYHPYAAWWTPASVPQPPKGDIE